MYSQSREILNDFLAACKAKRNIRVFLDAKKDARTFFNLQTEESIFKFISNDGLEELVLQDVEPWKNNPKPHIPVNVYAYGFKTGLKRGYIAFMYIKYEKKWAIKSFKPNNKQDTSFGDKLMKVVEQQKHLEEKNENI
ncbi:MAG: hypothetical protein RDU76_01855 [Candidatus Edwardsbacteria bacterium]|nr:hypothetical protein [Candidatus Edwardsbacteria bacterium]